MCQVRFFWGGGGKICMHCEVGEEWRKKAILCLCLPGWTCWLILVSAFWNQIHEDKEPGKLWSFWIFSSTFNPSNNYCLSVLGSLEFWWHKTNPHNSHFEVYFLCKLPCSAIVVNLSYVVMCIMFLLFTCSCGDGTLGTPNQRGDNYECRNMKLLLKQQQRVRLCAFVEFKGKCYCMIWYGFSCYEPGPVIPSVITLFTEWSCLLNQVLLGRSDVSGWGAFLKVIFCIESQRFSVLNCCNVRKAYLMPFIFDLFRIVLENTNTLVSILES